VDLLIERGGRFIAVECKYAETISERDTRALESLKKAYGPESLIAGYIASRSSRPNPISSGMKAVPGSFISEIL